MIIGKLLILMVVRETVNLICVLKIRDKLNFRRYFWSNCQIGSIFEQHQNVWEPTKYVRTISCTSVNLKIPQLMTHYWAKEVKRQYYQVEHKYS